MEDLLKLKDKTFVVMGVANNRSIGWGIAESLFKAGAKVIFTYRQERSLKKLQRLLDENGHKAELIVQCDVNDDESIKNAFNEIGKHTDEVAGIIHSIAHAHVEDLRAGFINTSREGFAFALDTSAYSLIAVAREAKPLLKNGGSIMALTYLGAEKAVPGYNVMGVAKAALEATVKYLALDLGEDGIRVNALSAGAIRTLAAKGVPSFNEILHIIEEKSPLKRNVTKEDVGDMALAMLSDLSRGTTGEIVYVDSGYNIVG